MTEGHIYSVHDRLSTGTEGRNSVYSRNSTGTYGHIQCIPQALYRDRRSFTVHSTGTEIRLQCILHVQKVVYSTGTLDILTFLANSERNSWVFV